MLRGLEPDQKAALLISECQKGVVDPALSPFPTLAEQVQQRQLVPRIARLAAAFRAAGLPVFHLHVVHRPDYADLPKNNVIIARSVKQGRMRRGTTDVEAIAGLEPQPDDVLHARTFSLGSFHGTDLDSMLRHMGVKTLVLTGVSSNVAIPGTALAGTDMGYQVLVPEDCIAGATAETHEFVVRNLLPMYATVTSQEAVEAALSLRAPR